MQNALPIRVQLGAFELDLKAGELRKGAQKIRLQEQPFQILLMLVERSGDLLTREIKKKLWPNDTVVEFDHSIHTAINKLRQALGDSADKPRYVETVARRGYRLLVPVECLESTPGDGPASDEVSGSPDGVAARMQLEAASLIGKKVSHYRVLEVIGGGGMGLVYKAEDLKLGRRVALKFLPEELANDAVALQRFEREAQTASSLNHPNICTIYEVEEHEDQPFIVMELLEGETLRDRLAGAESGAKLIPLDELLEIAIQICDGLEAAHRKNIIHRDIKPANIFLTTSGQVKILDFGLAKLLVGEDEGKVAARPDAPSASALATSVALALSRTGVAMGTAGYMSPEQVRGEKLDARTDLFSFGLVLYEMATGQRAFTGETAAVVHDAILNNSPVPVRELNSALPAKLVSTIDKALEKDRETRYQSAAEMRVDLEEVRSGKRPPASGSWKWFAAAALLIAVAVGGWLYWRSRNTLRLTTNDTIILADFTNSTSDSVFDDALNTALRVELEQTPFLNVLDADKVRGTLKLLHHPEDTKLTPELAREVCKRTNARAFVTGSIADAGNHYRIDLQGRDCQSGETLARARVQAPNRNQVVEMLGVAGSQLRREFGEPRASLEEFDKPLHEATSSSLEALQALSEGFRRHMRQGDMAALPYIKQAVELDPNYAFAHAQLGTVYIDLGEAALAAESARKAFELRSRLTQRHRFLIESLYHCFATGDLEKADQTFMQWIQTFPRDPSPRLEFAASLRYEGQHERAAAEAREANRLSPSVLAYSDLMNAYLSMDRLEAAKAAFEEAKADKLDAGYLAGSRYILAFLQGDEDSMKELLAEAVGKPGTEDSMLELQSATEAYYGRFRKARGFSRHAIDEAIRAKSADSAASYKTGEALREAEVGNATSARRLAMEALGASPSRNRRLDLALVFARIGDTSEAEKLAEELNEEFPLHTWMQKYQLTTIRAAIELNRNNPARALEILQSAAPYELASTEAFNNLYPAYIRGLAYLQAGQGQQAATEFQKLLDHRGVVQNYVTGALSHLQLGRAQAMMGDEAAARKSYQDFLTLWKDADPDIPVYEQAKAEYAKLQQSRRSP
jgi:serine/threonine protein kinase/tetratricopeptide (TPR) repeat protein